MLLYSAPMSPFPRYAIYYVPRPDSSLYRYGAELLGYDAFSGEMQPFPAEIVDAAPDWHALTQDPRKYGFHATLKAPFSLAAGNAEADLFAACDRFVATARMHPTITPVVNAISGFIAVIPDAPSPELERLAQDCVEAFDSLRAPMTPEDRARRNPTALTPRQVAQLDHWGYPYVLADFRFHMTLTGRVEAERRGSILAMLKERFSATGIKTLTIDSISLFRQDTADSRFRIIRQDLLTPTHD